MASGCPLPPPHGPKPRTVVTQLDRAVCGVRVASPIRRSGDRRDEKRPRFSRLAWQIPRCDSPAFRFSRSPAAGSTRSPDDGVLLDRPSRRGHPHPQGWFTGVPQVSSPASSDSTAPLTWGVGARRGTRARRPYPGSPFSAHSFHELAGLRERLVGRLRETLLDRQKGGQDGRPESDAGCQGANQSEIELGRLGATGGRYKAAPHGLGSTNRDCRARHASSFRVLARTATEEPPLRQRRLHDHRGMPGRDTSPRRAACRGVPPLTPRRRSTQLSRRCLAATGSHVPR